MAEVFRSGFVTLIGMPNAGKSTLLNTLMGLNLSIVTPKSHTTRERVLGIHNSPTAQLIFCDTPGLLTAAHALQRHMEIQLREALKGADVVLFLVSVDETPAELHSRYLQFLEKERFLEKEKLVLFAKQSRLLLC